LHELTKSKELGSQRNPSSLQAPKQFPPSSPAICFIKLFGETFKLAGRYGHVLASAISIVDDELRKMTMTPAQIVIQFA
jgi:hypothetical protein